MTQKGVVLRLLRERGSEGVTAHELVYGHGITRAAAIIFSLRHPDPGEGSALDIETIDDGPTPNGQRRLARYVLRSPNSGPRPAPAAPASSVAPTLPPAKLGLPCGCVRAEDGRSWDERCQRHGACPRCGILMSEHVACEEVS